MAVGRSICPPEYVVVPVGHDEPLLGRYAAGDDDDGDASFVQTCLWFSIRTNPFLIF